MFFLQMSGFPGSGKSTLAREIAKRTKAIIIDHDVTKSALLDSLNNLSLQIDQSGEISYNIDWSLNEFILSQGHSVIFDSPCLYQEIVDRGTSLAQKYQAKYKYIDVILDDINQINTRLKTRERMPSQITEVISRQAFNHAVRNSKKPVGYDFLLVDSSLPLESYLGKVLNYLNQ